MRLILDCKRTTWRRAFMGLGGLLFLGFSVSCMSLNFGGRTEIAPPANEATTEGFQRGKAYVPNGQEVSIYYPVPYVSPPNLELEDVNGNRHYQIVDQKPDHVRIKNLGGVGSEVPWKARGILVTSAKATNPVLNTQQGASLDFEQKSTASQR